MLPHPIARKYTLPESRYLKLEGLRIHYCIEGSGPTLVLLHGVLSSLHTWDGWAKALSPHYQVVRVDLPGFGLSSHLLQDRHYAPDHAIQLFDRVRRELGIGRFHLAGNSLGGFLSWFYAAAYPDHVDRLILLDPIAYSQKLPPLLSVVTLPLFGEVAGWVSPRFIVEHNVHRVYGSRVRASAEVVDRYHELLSLGRNRVAMVKTLRQIRRFNRDPEIARRVRYVRCPTLLMWGAEDRWVPPSLIASWQRDLPQARVKIYPGVGHVPMEEIPEQTAHDAHLFLSGNT